MHRLLFLFPELHNVIFIYLFILFSGKISPSGNGNHSELDIMCGYAQFFGIY